MESTYIIPETSPDPVFFWRLAKRNDRDRFATVGILPTIWTDEKQRWEESEKRREEKKKEDQKRERLRRKKIQVLEKVGKSRNIVFLQ